MLHFCYGAGLAADTSSNFDPTVARIGRGIRVTLQKTGAAAE